jgi:RsiW-degrading membrane proteinase PrsW (M82 family)
MWYFALAGSAVVPSLLLFWYIYSRDIHPEPRGMLLGTFGLGAATAIPVLILVLILGAVVGPPTGVWSTAAWTAFVHAAIPEESFKFLVLMTFCWRSRHFDEPFDGIVYGATASLGFATLENLLYVSQGGIGVAVLRAFTAVPGHAFTGVAMGYFVGRARFASAGRGWLAFQGLLYATVLHGLYNLFLMTNTGWFILSLPVLILEVALGILLIRRMRVDGFIPPVAPVPPEAVPYEVYGPGAPAAPPGGQPGRYGVGAPSPGAYLGGPAGPHPPAPPPASPAAPPAPGAGPTGAPAPPSMAPPSMAPPPMGPPPYVPPAGYGAPAPQPAPVPSVPHVPAPVSRRAAVRVIGGAMLASVSAVVGLAALGALVRPSPEDPGAAVLATFALAGVLGLGGGIGWFALGLRD